MVGLKAILLNLDPILKINLGGRMATRNYL